MKKICVYEFVICLVFNNYTLEQCSVMLRTPQGYNLEKKAVLPASQSKCNKSDFVTVMTLVVTTYLKTLFEACVCEILYSTSTYLNRWHMGLWYCQCVQQRSTFPCRRSWVQWGKSQRCRCTRCWRPWWNQTSQSFPVPEQHSEALKGRRVRRYLEWFVKELFKTKLVTEKKTLGPLRQSKKKLSSF